MVGILMYYKYRFEIQLQMGFVLKGSIKTIKKCLQAYTLTLKDVRYQGITKCIPKIT